MEELSIWHWAVMLAMFVGFIGLPVAGTLSENSQRRMPRRPFILYLLAVLVGCVAVPNVADLIWRGAGVPAYLLFLLALQFDLQRRLVRRARDAGKGKWPAWIAVFPSLGIPVCIVLAFMPTRASAPLP